MGKKIIFIGPADAGKTTLRKVFFEGENSSKLLKFGLEPTHGKESILINLDEKIGIFDLAGQENKRWLETEDKEIFYETEIIIVVFDISKPYNEIPDFIKRVFLIREELTPKAFIYILLHKRDLISDNNKTEIMLKLSDIIKNENNIKVAFTSIQKQFFIDTFSLFIEILKNCLDKDTQFYKFNLNLIKNYIELTYELRKYNQILKSDLYNKINLTEHTFDYLIDILKSNDLINISKKRHKELIILTDKGQDFLDNIVKDFSPVNLFKAEKSQFGWVMESVKMPPLLGFAILDNKGKTLMNIEIYEGALDSFLKFGVKHSIIDFEIIPLLINALEKVRKIKNINQSPEIDINGTNIKILTLKLDIFTIIIYMHIDTNIDPFNQELIKFFQNIFLKNKEIFDKYLKTGKIDLNSQIIYEGKTWLNEINKNYEKRINNLEFLDLQQSKNLYKEMDELAINAPFKSHIFLRKLRLLRSNLLKSIINDNFKEIRKISLKLKDLIKT